MMYHWVQCAILISLYIKKGRWKNHRPLSDQSGITCCVLSEIVTRTMQGCDPVCSCYFECVFIRNAIIDRYW